MSDSFSKPLKLGITGLSYDLRTTNSKKTAQMQLLTKEPFFLIFFQTNKFWHQQLLIKTKKKA